MRHRMPEAAAAEGWNMAMEDVKHPRLHGRYARLLSKANSLSVFISYVPTHYIFFKTKIFLRSCGRGMYCIHWHAYLFGGVIAGLEVGRGSARAEQQPR